MLTRFFICFFLLLCFIGTFFAQQRKLDSLLVEFKNAKEDTNKATILIQISSLYIQAKEYKKAEEYLKKSLSLANSIGALVIIKDCEKLYYRLDSIKGNFKGAMDHYKKYIAISDSINNITNFKKQIRSEIIREFEEKRAKELAKWEKRLTLIEEENKKLTKIRFVITIIFVLMIVFTIFLIIQRLRK